MSKYFSYNLFVVLIVSFMLLSCAEEVGVSKPTNEPIVTASSTSVKKIAPTESEVFLPEVDLVINLENAHRSIVEVQEGQVFQIERPSLASEWQVSFDPDLFEPLTSLEMMRSPGEDGWFFRAKSQGDGYLVFTSIVSCDSPEPCSMMPARLEITVSVQ